MLNEKLAYLKECGFEYDPNSLRMILHVGPQPWNEITLTLSAISGWSLPYLKHLVDSLLAKHMRVYAPAEDR